ncbi:thiamine phosphate synthase [Candidatus Pelagibacter ubique]|jgi:thiamine-phosphate pyrophosphorylase|nr:thiamine phosphate synthase [Candidatus Pelagibacter ubique]
MHNKIINKYNFIKEFDQSHLDKQDKKTIIIFRNYIQQIDEELILKIKNYCKKRGNKFLISNNIKLAIKLNLDGAYIPAFNKSFWHNSYSLKKNFKLVGSAHNLTEIKIKERQNVSSIFISSIFKNNKCNKFLGIYRFLNLIKLTKKNVVCLGGINKNNIKKIKLLNIKNIASITMFQNL